VKWVFVLVGKIRIVVGASGEETTTPLHKSQAFAFDARRPHHFENASQNTSLAIVVHYPTTNSGLLAAG
jgi:hypothetical protein